jgi:ankyrin repeat protein
MTNWEQYRETMTRPATLGDAAKDNDVATLGRLLDAGAPIDEVDARGYSALMLAAYGGHAEACAYLIQRGADVNTRDHAGNTVLMGACFKGHLEIVRALLAAGADLQRKNGAGMDAAAFASMFGRADVLALITHA